MQKPDENQKSVKDVIVLPAQPTIADITNTTAIAKVSLNNGVVNGFKFTTDDTDPTTSTVDKKAVKHEGSKSNYAQITECDFTNGYTIRAVAYVVIDGETYYSVEAVPAKVAPVDDPVITATAAEGNPAVDGNIVSVGDKIEATCDAEDATVTLNYSYSSDTITGTKANPYTIGNGEAGRPIYFKATATTTNCTATSEVATYYVRPADVEEADVTIDAAGDVTVAADASADGIIYKLEGETDTTKVPFADGKAIIDANGAAIVSIVYYYEVEGVDGPITSAENRTAQAKQLMLKR